MGSTYQKSYNNLLQTLQEDNDWVTSLPRILSFFAENSPYVVIESPYAALTQAEIETNVDYARAACRNALVNHGEIPFASHLKYTQEGILRDDVEWERALGIAAGLTEGFLASKTIVYVDRGVSAGMLKGIQAAHKSGRPIHLRSLSEWGGRDAGQNLARIQRFIASELSIPLDEIHFPPPPF